MITTKIHPTKAELRVMFSYSESQGQLIWEKPLGTKTRKGSIAGNIQTSNKGYRAIGINGKKYAAHRLIWIFHNGAIPVSQTVDHIIEQPTGVHYSVINTKDNNHIANLQLLSSSDQHRKARSFMKSNNIAVGVKLVNDKFQVRIGNDNVSKYLGRFDTKEEAIKVRQDAELLYWGKNYNKTI